MGTTRISVLKYSPSTEFTLECNRISQNIAGNSTRLRLYFKSINRGNTSSWSGWYGYQKISIPSHWGGATQSGNPFLPSGYAHDQVRWYKGAYDVDISHGADGTRGAVTLRMQLEYGNGAVNETHNVSFNDFPDIPRGPRVKDAGIWKNTLAYIRSGGIWKIALPYVKSGGIWRIGGG